MNWRGLMERKAGRLVFYAAGDQRRNARIMALIGLLLALPAVAAWPLFMVHTFAGIMALTIGGAGVLILVVALVIWQGHNGRTVVDPAARTISDQYGKVHAFDDVAGVHCTSYVQTHSTGKGGTIKMVRYSVRLITGEVAAAAREVLTHADATIRSVLAEQEASLTAGQAAEIQQGLGELAPLLEGATLPLADHLDRAVVWRASELLARLLGVPLIDASSEQTLLRTPAELDLPLGERLRQLGQRPPAPGFPPGGLQTTGSEGLNVSWPARSEARLLAGIFALVFGFTAIIGHVAGLPWPWLISLWAVVLVLVGLTLALHAWVPPRRLVLDEGRVSYKAWGAERRTMGTGEIEAINVDTSIEPRVMLIGDKATICCTLNTNEQARWLGQALERCLYQGPEAPQGPYR